MTGQTKAIIALAIVILLAATVFLTWLVTKRSLSKIQADQPISLPASSATTQTSKTEPDTTTSEKVLIPLVKGWNFRAVPDIVSPNQGSSVFSKLASGDAFYLDIDSQKYISFLESGTVVPGKGNALRSEKGEVLELVSNSASPVDETKPFTIGLKKGWNLVGNPFNKDITWNPTIESTNQKFSLEKAIEQNIVSKSYAWSPSSESYLEVKPGQTLKKFQAILIKSGGSAKLTSLSE